MIYTWIAIVDIFYRSQMAIYTSKSNKKKGIIRHYNCSADRYMHKKAARIMYTQGRHRTYFLTHMFAVRHENVYFLFIFYNILTVILAVENKFLMPMK